VYSSSNACRGTPSTILNHDLQLHTYWEWPFLQLRCNGLLRASRTNTDSRSDRRWGSSSKIIIAQAGSHRLVSWFAPAGNRSTSAAGHESERLSRSEQGVRLVQQEVFHLFDVFEQRLDQIQGSIPVQRHRRDRGTSYRDYHPAVRASGRFRANVEIAYLNTVDNVTSHAKLGITLFTWPPDIPPQLAELTGQRDEILRRLFAPRFADSETVRWKNAKDFASSRMLLDRVRIHSQAKSLSNAPRGWQI
jgi:hypothetical protein